MTNRNLLLAALLLGAACGRPPADPLEVTVEGGRLRGARAGDVLAWKGIPYAAPPVGPLRWTAPRPVPPWQGVRDASAFGHDCVQHPMPGDAAASGAALGEDCLTLNVWRPAPADTASRLPVLVWIHGGGYLNGGSSAPILDGTAFARDSLVFVSFNYRLGRLGFFAHPALTAAAEGPLGNYGLLDQRAALEWVRRNIAAFGGDPARVTLVGESAGGISIMHLLTWPAARGLFHGAVVMSGGGRSFLVTQRRLAEPQGPLPSAEAAGVAFAESVGIADTGAAALAALRALPAERVNGDLDMGALLAKPATYVGGPIVDGSVVTGRFDEAIRRGDVADVPVLIGSTSADLPVTFPPDPTQPFAMFGPAAARARALYGPLPPKLLVLALAADLTMQEPARFVATRWAAAGRRAWLYRFGYVADSARGTSPGAPHASDVPFLFATVDTRYGAAATERDRAVARLLHGYVANFAKRGDPNGAGLPAWAPADTAAATLMTFTPDGDARTLPDPWRERLELVREAVER